MELTSCLLCGGEYEMLTLENIHLFSQVNEIKDCKTTNSPLKAGDDQNSDNQLFGEHLDPPEPLELSLGPDFSYPPF